MSKALQHLIALSALGASLTPRRRENSYYAKPDDIEKLVSEEIQPDETPASLRHKIGKLYNDAWDRRDTIDKQRHALIKAARELDENELQILIQRKSNADHLRKE